MTTTQTIPDDWRFFDNGGRTLDRYSIWQDDGWLNCSADPFYPLGVCMHSSGLNPDALDSARPDWKDTEKEISFADLPADVQRAVRQDAELYDRCRSGDLADAF